MKASTIVALVFVGIISLFGISIFSMYVSAHNYAVTAEEGIKAAYTDNQNVLSAYTVKIQEMAQVPEMYKNDLKELYSSAMAGRYGEDGSKAMFQWLKEVNPSLDNSLYTRLQQTMEAGRNEFRVHQTALIDRKREYQTQQGLFMRGFFIRLAGYPKINLDDFKVVLDGQTNEAFNKGVTQPIKLR